MDDDTDPGRVRRSLERIGVEHVTDAVAWTWVEAGFDADREQTWPEDERRYAFELAAADDPVGLDTLAAVLDETPRDPARLFVHVAVGRRDDPPPGRNYAVETLSRHTDVTVSDHHTVGTVPLTAETFETLVRLYGDELVHATVFDEADLPVVERRDWTTLRFAVPEAVAETVRSSLPASVAERLERR